MASNKVRQWSTSTEWWERLKPLARENRHLPTAAEKRLWQVLRNCALEGLRFRRQHPIERFIVDFYCREARLVVEVDGPIHERTVENDAIREAYLKANGLTVVHFKNEDVFSRLDQVLAAIAAASLLLLSVDGEGAGG